jgi:hypothetical protein
MNSRTFKIGYFGTALLTSALAIRAQNVSQPESPTSAGNSPLYDPQQFPSHRGQVLQFTLTPRGDIDGLILKDGTEVKIAPHLSTQIAYSIKPGDAVTIHGLRAAAIPMMQAVSITDETSGRTVVDEGSTGPDRGPRRPPARAAAPGSAAPPSKLTELNSRVRVTLHGPQGEVNGALLEDGTVLRLPPPDAQRLAALLQPGHSLFARGTTTPTAIGNVFVVQQVGASRDAIINTLPQPR